MKKIILGLTFMAGMFCVNAQSELDAYKYVIIQKQYSFQKSPDKYQLNSLAKFLLEKSDLKVLFATDQFPDDIALNRCLAVKAEIVDSSGMLKTKLLVNFRDCKNRIVYTTVLGRSNSKDYKKGYQEALRQSLAVFLTYKHRYTGTSIKIVQKEIPVLKESPEIASVTYTEAKSAIKNNPNGIKLSFLGVYTNGGMSFEVKGNGSDFELIHPEIGKIADVYKTSKAAVFIVQWTGKKQSKLMEVSADGSLNIDGDNGINTYKKRH